MKLLHAQKLASEIVGKLRPYVDQIEVAGSIRRLKPEVKDIEILVIPKQLPAQQALIGGPEYERHPGFAKTVSQWKKVKGDASTGKYTQRSMAVDYPSIYEKEIKIDIFIVTKENWGSQLVLRTGDAEFSHKLFGFVLPSFGLKMDDGFVWDGGKILPVENEDKLFALVNLPNIPPHLRNINFFKK